MNWEWLICILGKAKDILFSDIFYAILIPTSGLIVSHYLLLRREKYIEKRKITLEEQKKFNRMLFSLLKIKWYIKSKVIEYKSINFYCDEVKKMALNREEIIPKSIMSMIRDQFREILPDNSKSNIEVFKNDIYELSLYSPIQAYKLDGKEGIITMIKNWDNQIKHFWEDLNNYSSLEDLVNEEKDKALVNLHNTLVDDIKNIILPNITDKKIKLGYKELDNSLELDEEYKEKIRDLVKKIEKMVYQT